MHHLSKSAAMGFEDAVAAAKAALKHRGFAIVAEIDLGQALRSELVVDSRRYVILSACSLPLAHRAIELDSEVGSILLCNLAVHDCEDGRVEISAADPLAMIGSINHVELIWIARELQSLIQQVIDDIEPFPKFDHALRNRDDAGHQLARALP